MDLESIYALMERFERSSLTGLELEQNGTRLKLDRTVTAAPAAAAPIPAAPQGHCRHQPVHRTVG